MTTLVIAVNVIGAILNAHCASKATNQISRTFFTFVSILCITMVLINIGLLMVLP